MTYSQKGNMQQEHQDLLNKAQASSAGGQSSMQQTRGTMSPQNTQSKSQTVIAVFDSRRQADYSVGQLRQQGFRQEEISIVAKQTEDTEGYNDSIADGVATGGAIGGIGGLMAAAGALAIPGFGPIIALGPIAAALSGAVAGGVAGGLIDYGIPAERGREYEEQIRRGKVLAIIKVDSSKASQAANILRQNGAANVEMHTTSGA